ncbi:MAG: DNA polymerase III subunit delta' [Waddliaceae bacterium]|nr:DNA polymerase III subunit delta' [Waddliaceae bacterium]
MQNLIGNEDVLRYIDTIIDKNAVANSLLFSGPEGVGKFHFAMLLGQKLISGGENFERVAQRIEAGNHPDFRVYRPEGKLGLHSIQSMRQFSEEVYLRPYEAKWKVFIIDAADRMVSFGANALLKTFEEPAEDTIIILISDHPEALLPTIRSRCRTIHFLPVPEPSISDWLVREKGLEQVNAAEIAALSRGAPARALRLLERGEDPKRKILLEILEASGTMPYGKLHHSCKEIADLLDKDKKALSEQLSEELYAGYGEQVSAVQKQVLDRELEGALTRYQLEELEGVLQDVIAWHRDLLLLSSNGSENLLFHRDKKEKLRSLLNRPSVPLEKVFSYVDEVRQGIQRSMPTAQCLEHLFLRLS